MNIPSKVMDLRKLLLVLFIVFLSLTAVFSVEYFPDETAFSINCIALSTDGKSLLAGYIDNTVKVWNLLDGKLSMNLSLHSSWVTSLAVSPDGRLGIAGYDDGMIIVWEMETGKPLKSLSSHTSSVNYLLVTEDGKTLYSAGSDGTVKVWSLSELAFIRSLRGHSGPVNSIVHWPEQNRLYSVSDDGTLRIWDTSTGQQVKVIKAEIGALSSVNMDEKRSILVVGSKDGPLKFYDVKTWSALRIVKAHNAEVTAIIIRGDLIFTSSRDRTVKILSLPLGSLVKMITGHTWDVSSIVLSGDSSIIYSGSSDGTVKIWDVDKGVALGTLIGFGDGEYFSYNGDGNWVASSKGASRVKTSSGKQPNQQGTELSSLLLQLEKLPRIYVQSPQSITIDNTDLTFVVSQPVVRVTVNDEEIPIGESGKVTFRTISAGALTIKAFDSIGNFDEKILEVQFEETKMYVIDNVGPYRRGDQVVVSDRKDMDLLVNGEWLSREFFSDIAPDIEPPQITGQTSQQVMIGHEKHLNFVVTDNNEVKTVIVIGPDEKRDEVSVNSPHENIRIKVAGTGEYRVTAIDNEGNEAWATFSLYANAKTFWVERDQGSLRRGQEVTVTAEGESSFFVKEYGWVEKDVLTETKIITESPIIEAEDVQYADANKEKMLNFKVSDDIKVLEVEVSEKRYPVDLKEKEMFVIVGDYGEYRVVARDLEGNTSEKTIRLAAPAMDEKKTNWRLVLVAVAAIAILLLLIFRSSFIRKKKRKVRLM
jgi:WD40 repeat protein